MPNKKPKYNPLLRINTNSFRPHRRNSSTIIFLSRVMAPTTCVLTSHNSGTRVCISRRTALTKTRPCFRARSLAASVAANGSAETSADAHFGNGEALPFTVEPVLLSVASPSVPNKSITTLCAIASIPGSSKFPHSPRSRRPKTSRTSSNRLVIRSTIVLDILRTLHGTMPCHPNNPNGVSGHRFQLKPKYSSGEKIIVTASALVNQFRTPATIGMVA
mmetsp:Transcript_4214/g.15497  ORF Transcript_4214/g.15497 Transcript_4214/m.15497 type:complete len:218 (-) Transcript_4214:620-1273(-)